ncbi:MAG: site-specific integrase, partial [Mycobacteriaceae bacterium]
MLVFVPEPSPQLSVQMQGYLDHLAVEKGSARNTLESYRRDLGRYQQHLAERGITDLAAVHEQDVSA